MKEKESVRATRKTRTYKVEVDEEECVENCPVDVFEMQDEKSVPVDAEECIGCETCIELCEQEAITVTEID
jgi:NAD-dependent dihydropyrimidine dehydrogenase PreA subunit